MITKVLELQAKTDKAQANLSNITSELENINENVSKTEKGLEDVQKTSEKSAKGFKKMGLAIKAVGIGLLVKGLTIVQDLFNSNQKIVDGYTTAINFITIAFNDFFGFISDNVDAVTGFFKKIFNNPVDSINRFSTAIQKGLIDRFNQFKETLGILGESLSALFEGDFKKSFELAKKAAVESVDIITGQEDGVQAIKETFKSASDTIKDYTQSTFEAAQQQTELGNKAEISAAINQGLIEKFDRQAELQRQIRDDERLTVEERLAANVKLGEILDEQENTMKENAQTALQLANQQLALDENNVQAQVAKIEALNELAAIEATVDGFRSEQLTNQASLEKELKELTNSRLESEANLSIEQKRFNAEQIEDNLQRLQRQKEIDTEEKELQTARLQAIIDNANAGTQAKIDAEIALNEFLQESDQKEIERKKEIVAEKKRLDDQDLANDNAIRDAKIANQQALVSATSSALNSIASLAGEGTKIAKIAAIADIIIGTGIGFINGLDIAQKSAKATGPGAAAAFPIFYATQVAAVLSAAARAKSILSKAKGPQPPTITPPTINGSGGGTSGTSGPLGTAASQPANFNVVGQSGFNQISQAIQQQGPVQAFVVGSEVTTQQQLDNAIVSTATLGN